MVQSKPYQEKLAAAHVALLDLEVLLPRWIRKQPVGGVLREVIKPLFPGYFFARFSPGTVLDAVRSRPGVLRVLGGRQGPIEVQAEVVDEIRIRFATGTMVRSEEPALQRGTRVRIECGPFQSWIGHVEREEKDATRVAIFLEAMSQVRLVVERQDVSVVAGD